MSRASTTRRTGPSRTGSPTRSGSRAWRRRRSAAITTSSGEPPQPWTDVDPPRRPTREEVTLWLRLHKPYRRPRAWWKILQLLVAGSPSHAFLDRRFVGPLLALTPETHRRALAIRLLALSPHYWVYQWGNRYPQGDGRAQVLAHEVERVTASRQALCDRLLLPFLRWDMTVLDLGTGPGFLARPLSHRVAKVVACDVSRGVIACARVLNPAANLTYLATRADSLRPVPDASIDVAVAIAVLQHLTPANGDALLREIGRVLSPGGLGLCHLRLEDPEDQRQWSDPPTGWRARLVEPRMRHFKAPEVVATLRGLGFTDVAVRPIRELTTIDDDIQGDHLASFRRPGDGDPDSAP